MIRFTPKKFIDAIELNGVNFTTLVKSGMDRSYFIPRYKKGSHKKRDLTYDYKKGISRQSIDNIAQALVNVGLFKEEDKPMIVSCFFNNDFERLLPKDLL